MVAEKMIIADSSIKPHQYHFFPNFHVPFMCVCHNNYVEQVKLKTGIGTTYTRA